MRPLTATESNTVKTYHYRAWVHPKNGGDDREYDVSIIAETPGMADKEIRNWLKKKSDVIEDYRLVKTTEARLQPVQLTKKQQERLDDLKRYIKEHTKMTDEEIEMLPPNQVLECAKNTMTKETADLTAAGAIK